jgi:hypothetical protein
MNASITAAQDAKRKDVYRLARSIEYAIRKNED